MTDSTDEDLLSRIVRDLAAREQVFREARENIERVRVSLRALGPQPTGGAVAEPGAAGDVGIIRIAPRASKPIPAKWFKVLKTCPHCGKEKNVGRDFGIITRNGNTTAASWCKECRGKTSYPYRKKKVT